MSSILIHDLERNSTLDGSAMVAVRGGTAWGPDVNVNINLDQKIAQFQDIGVNVLNNNGVIGAGFTAPSVAVNPSLWAMNSAVIPKLA